MRVLKKIVLIFLAVISSRILYSCSSDFNQKTWEGAIFKMDNSLMNEYWIDNDSARIMLFADSVCRCEYLSFVEFDDSTKLPKKFLGKWFLTRKKEPSYPYEENDCMIIEYKGNQIYFWVKPSVMFGTYKPSESSLNYYIGNNKYGGAEYRIFFYEGEVSKARDKYGNRRKIK